MMEEERFNIGCPYFESQEFDRVKCKVIFYNNCGVFKKILFSLMNGRDFVPTGNEKRLVCLEENR